MNTKKLMTISCILTMTILIALGGLWQPAAAKSGVYRLQEGETIGLGRQGLYLTNIPHGVSDVYLDTVGTRLPPRFNHKMDMKYRAPALEVRFLNERGGEIDQISALVYVFFKISRAERAMWLESGMERIAIWYANLETGRWEMCPTFFVNKSHGKETFGRLACLAPGSGFYVLGQGDFGEYLIKLKAEDSAEGVQPASSQGPTTLNVRAYIDGRSQLIIQGDKLYWHHLDFAAPGCHEDAEVNQPTYLNQAAWEPVWPDVPDAENRDCNCDSSSYQGIPNLASTNQRVGFDILRARGEVIVIQHPSADNNYALVIELDDNPLIGPDWYEVNLNYIVGAVE
jgi:hypothetical protein